MRLEKAIRILNALGLTDMDQLKSFFMCSRNLSAIGVKAYDGGDKDYIPFDKLQSFYEQYLQ